MYAVKKIVKLKTPAERKHQDEFPDRARRGKPVEPCADRGRLLCWHDRQILRNPAASYRVTGGGSSRLTTTSTIAGFPDSSARRSAGRN